MLRLLCPAHELELESTGLQASRLRRDGLLCQQDLVLQRGHRHRLLCEQLIREQQQLMQGEARAGLCLLICAPRLLCEISALGGEAPAGTVYIL